MKLHQKDLIQKLSIKIQKKPKIFFLRINKLKIFYAFGFNLKVCDFEFAYKYTIIKKIIGINRKRLKPKTLFPEYFKSISEQARDKKLIKKI